MITYNNSVLKVGSSWLHSEWDPNPLNLPPFTMRFQFGDGASMSSSYNPTTSGQTWKTGAVWTQVSTSPNVWDYTRVDTDWDEEFYQKFSSPYVDYDTFVLGGNTAGVTNMHSTFRDCDLLRAVKIFDTRSVTDMNHMFSETAKLGYSMYNSPVYNLIDGVRMALPLFDTSSVTDMSYMFIYASEVRKVPRWNTSSVTDMTQMFANSPIYTVPLFDTSSVTSMYAMFRSCSSLSAIPLFDTRSVVDMRETFYGCRNVASGALALYNQASSQTTPPSGYSQCFSHCGEYTTTGAAELAQIPTSWGGTMA